MASDLYVPPIGSRADTEQRAVRAVEAAYPPYGGDVSWMALGRCAETDAEIFFPGVGVNAREARKICRSCEVRAQCLEYALAADSVLPGVWGGMSEQERRALRRGAA